MAALLDAWEWPNDSEIPLAPPGARRQYSLRTLLLGMSIMGAILGISAKIARQIQIAATPIEWRPLSVDEVPKLSDQQRYVIFTHDIHLPTFATLCATTEEAYNNVELRMAFHRWQCKAFYIKDPDAYLALKQRFRNVDGTNPWLYVENGKVITASEAKRRWG